jgi:hypothetical protein
MPVRQSVPSRPYRLELADHAGPYDIKYFKHFKSMCEQAIRWRKEFPDKSLAPSNSDRADYDTNGLTEEEEEQFWEVLSENAK